MYGENGIANEVSFSIDGHSETLSHFFSSYGKPDEIWMSYLIPHFAERYILLGLYYEHENVFIWYDMQGEINGYTQHGCGLDFFNMFIWSDMKEEQEIRYLYSLFYPGDKKGLRETSNISTLTSLNIDSFYDEFSNSSDNDVCISINLETNN